MRGQVAATYDFRVLALARSSFSTVNAEEALPVLTTIYPDLTLAAAEPGAFRFDIDSVDTGLLSTVRYRLTSPNSMSTADGTGSLSIAHIVEGRMRMFDGRNEVDMTKPFLAPERRFGGTWDDVQVGGLSLDRLEVERFATLLAGSDSFRLAFTGLHPITPAMSRFWTTTVRTLNRDLLRDTDAMASALVHRAAFEQLALAVLAVFPNTLMDLRDPRDTTRAVPAALRRATGYIDDNLGAEITVADIAAAAGLSVRGLTAAFRREFDTTPMAYLRAGRLDAVHRDLMAADPGAGHTVTTIANRWGFNNRGRFATAYRQQYGISPATTLRD
jgi:AraC-like DNA-binding protein